jgi:hypothetical protein
MRLISLTEEELELPPGAYFRIAKIEDEIGDDIPFHQVDNQLDIVIDPYSAHLTEVQWKGQPLLGVLRFDLELDPMNDVMPRLILTMYEKAVPEIFKNPLINAIQYTLNGSAPLHAHLVIYMVQQTKGHSLKGSRERIRQIKQDKELMKTAIETYRENEPDIAHVNP